MLDLMVEENEQVERADNRKRTRLIIDTDEVVRLAVKLRALRTGKDGSEVVNDILKKALAAEINEASGFPLSDTGKKPGRKRKD